jgi:hypothetical protein
MQNYILFRFEREWDRIEKKIVKYAILVNWIRKYKLKK